ncbi:MAG: hypothetical protein Q7T79_00675 [bacterium]|nr:hypothetical protein [bacterium]
MMLTTEQYNKLSTKDDFEKFGKKFDKKIDELSVKTDKKFDAVDKKIDELSVKTDAKFDASLLLFATKEDLKDLSRELKEYMAEETNKILNAIDGIVKKHSDFEIEMTANQGAHDRFEEQFIETDQRVKVLEKKFDVSNI